MEPLKIIEALKITDPYIEMIFMQGGCYKFHLFLKSIFPESKPYLSLDRDHIVTKIGRSYYDIRGRLKKGHSFLYEPLDDEDLELVESWSFSRSMALQIKECPACEEPIVV